MASKPYESAIKTGDSFNLRDYLPFLDWLLHYRRENLSSDLIAGVIVAVMLVPQGMAYALLAGLPPQVGLYASVLPLVLYGLLGTSRALAVGPVAMVSLLVASGIAVLNPASPADAMAYALVLAGIVGLTQFLMGVFRVGFLVNFLSHPVLSGFTSAAALVIGFSQLKHILGFDIPRTEHFHELIIHAVTHISQTNPAALAISVISIGTLLYFKYGLGDHLAALGISKTVRVSLTKVGPLVIVIVGTLLVYGLSLHETAQVSIIGAVPAGLPPLTLPVLDWNVWQALLPMGLTISLVSYMESISVAKALASKRREKVDANQELIALGSANIGAALTGGYPVTGGFSRSMVNFTAGARTGLASMVTAGLVLVTVLFMTSLFFYLPNAVLAAIIVVSVSTLVDWHAFVHAWHYSKLDALSLAITFFAVLQLGIETGIIVGVITSLVLYLWRTSRPHVAVVGRIEGTEEYRNVLRHDVETHASILALRIDESLYFPNAQYLEEVVLTHIADQPQIKHFVLVCSAVNFIDTSALEVLEKLDRELHESGVQLYMAEVKGPVMDRLKRIGFVDQLGRDHFFLTTHQACETLRDDADAA